MCYNQDFTKVLFAGSSDVTEAHQFDHLTSLLSSKIWCPPSVGVLFMEKLSTQWPSTVVCDR